MAVQATIIHMDYNNRLVVKGRRNGGSSNKWNQLDFRSCVVKGRRNGGSSNRDVAGGE